MVGIKKICVCTLACVMFSACASKAAPPEPSRIKLNADVIDDITVQRLDRVGFFVSKDVVLRRTDRFVDRVEADKGEGTRVIKDIVEDITISSMRSLGKLEASKEIEYRGIIYEVFGVGFEDSHNDILGFAAMKADPTAPFYLQYDDPDERTIEYLGHTYTVDYDGEEPPFLMVHLKDEVIYDNRSHTASGRSWDE